MNKRKKEPWRIIVATIAIAYIVYMWEKKDISAIYSIMSKEQIMLLLATSLVVTLVKIAGIIMVILLIKWIVEKMSKKK